MIREENLAKAVELRHQLHAHPELSDQEVWTRNHLMTFLRENTEHLEIVDRGLWFYAVYYAGKDKENIAFRADFDAVAVEEKCSLPYASQFPGIAHKCGHDGHSATLALLAMEVDQQGADKNVYFIFQHAEENGNGAKYAAELIDEKKIQEIYCYHNMNGIPMHMIALRDGTVNCASKGLIIEFIGTPTHAGAPENGKNPALALSRVVCAIPEIVNPANYKGIVLCTVIQIDLGEAAFGISAGRGRLLLTLRAQYELEMNLIQQKLEDRIKQECQAEGLSWSFGESEGFPETANDKECADKIRKACDTMGLVRMEEEEPNRPSEDYGYYLKRTKGAVFHVGTGENAPAPHTVMYDFPDEIMETAASVFLQLIRQK